MSSWLKVEKDQTPQPPRAASTTDELRAFVANYSLLTALLDQCGVPVIGVTRSGKSLLVQYMMGAKYIYHEERDTDVCTVEQPNSPRVGDDDVVHINCYERLDRQALWQLYSSG